MQLCEGGASQTEGTAVAEQEHTRVSAERRGQWGGGAGEEVGKKAEAELRDPCRSLTGLQLSVCIL